MQVKNLLKFFCKFKRQDLKPDTNKNRSGFFDLCMVALYSFLEREPLLTSTAFLLRI